MRRSPSVMHYKTLVFFSAFLPASYSPADLRIHSTQHGAMATTHQVVGLISAADAVLGLRRAQLQAHTAGGHLLTPNTNRAKCIPRTLDPILCELDSEPDPSAAGKLVGPRTWGLASVLCTAVPSRAYQSHATAKELRQAQSCRAPAVQRACHGHAK